MLNTSTFGRVARLVVLVAALALSASAWADDGEELARAIRMFEEGKYLAAQEVLLEVGPEGLSQAQRAQRDEYLDRVQVALSMVEKASNDLDDALQAVEDGELDEADALLRGVLRNEYASGALRRGAVEELRKVEALRSGEAIEPAPAAEPVAEPADTSESTTVTTIDVTAAEPGQDRPPAEQAPAEPARPALQADPGSLINRIRAGELIKWQRTVAQYREAERTVRELLIEDRYAEARQALLNARQIVEAGRQYADPLTKYESLKSEVNALAAYVDDEERRYNEGEVTRQRAEIVREREVRLRKIRETQQRQIDLLMEQAFQLRKDRDYAAAIDTVQQVIALDSNNGQARLMLDLLEDLHMFTTQRAHHTTKGREMRRLLIDVEGDKIPWHEEHPIYPDDWLEIISSEERGEYRGERLNEQDLALQAQLDKTLAVNYEDATFEEVIDDLAERQNANITVVWTDLEALGVERDQEVTLQLASEISFKSALEQILELVGGTDAELAYVVSDGMIKIASKDLLDRDVYTEVYDIRDLLVVIPDFTNDWNGSTPCWSSSARPSSRTVGGSTAGPWQASSSSPGNSWLPRPPRPTRKCAACSIGSASRRSFRWPSNRGSSPCRVTSWKSWASTWTSC